MVVYNFKKIRTVPSASDLIDIVLSMTQRKTPTVVHKGYKITRIRSFYMRKVKYTQQNFHDKLAAIIEDFPILDAIHPFYADLMNVLYDRDHFKLALGQINAAKTFIDNVAKDYVRLLKYAESLYQCKQLKRAGLGRMGTVVKRLNSSLIFLEQVRQHLSRLPSIDPTTRTLIVAGFPNVGKSSFMNKVTNANVDVQPYPFTTRSLFVGHLDYNYLRWQVIDTPGVLDHSLEERNTIEMMAITALAHLRAAVLFFVDISAQCGHSIKDQLTLFENIKPLFLNKPLVLVMSKTDATRFEELDDEDRALIESAIKHTPGATLLSLSTHADEGVAEVVKASCDRLLDMRVEQKLKTKSTSSGGVLAKLHVAQPKTQRMPFIPDSVLRQRAQMSDDVVQPSHDTFNPAEVEPSRRSRGSGLRTVRGPDAPPLERDLETAAGGAGAYNVDLRKLYMLKDEEWKYDVIPEIMDGRNIADFVDPEIEARLAALEKEEEALEAAALGEMSDDEEPELTKEEKGRLRRIRDAKSRMIEASRRKRNMGRAPMNRKQLADTERQTSTRMRAELSALGLDPENAVASAMGARRDAMVDDGEPIRARSRSRGRKRGRSVVPDTDDIDMEGKHKRKLLREASRARSTTRGPADTSLKDDTQRLGMLKESRKAQAPIKRMNRKGEADRSIPTSKPKHLFSGKRRGQHTASHR